jgi:hypothetical protein
MADIRNHPATAFLVCAELLIVVVDGNVTLSVIAFVLMQ